MIITADELKTKGITFFEKFLKKTGEIIVSVKGKPKFVLIDFERYNKIKELEVEKAYTEVMEDYKNGKYTTDITAHIKELEKECMK